MTNNKTILEENTLYQNILCRLIEFKEKKKKKKNSYSKSATGMVCRWSKEYGKSSVQWNRESRNSHMYLWEF